MTNIAKVKSMLIQRENAYEIQTKKIFRMFETTMLAASERFMRLTYGEYVMDRLKWIDLMFDTFTDDDEEEIPVVVFRGYLEFNPGDSFIDGAGRQHVDIDEKTAFILSSPFILQIPLELAEQGTADEIFNFFMSASKNFDEFAEYANPDVVTLQEVIEDQLVEDEEDTPRILH